MKLKYINQLTNSELVDLYSAFIKTYGDFKVKHVIIIKNSLTITLKGSYYAVDDNGNDYGVLNDSFELNDYGVLNNAFDFGYNGELTKIVRKRMLNKFEEPYMKDCFWNDFGGEDDD